MQEKKFYPWFVVGMLWIVALLNYLDRQMLSTMQQSIGITIPAIQDPANFGRLMAIFLWIYGCISPISGAIADKLNRKWLIVGSLGVWSAVTSFMSLCTSYESIYTLRAIMGVSEALYIPAGLSLIADYFTGKGRSLAIGIHMTGLYTGQALGGFGATVADLFSWQDTFRWFGIAGVIYAVVLVLFLRDKRSTPEIEAQELYGAEAGAEISKVEKFNPVSLLKGFGLIFSNIAFWVILFFFASSSLPGWSTKNWLPTLFAENLGLAPGVAGPASTISIAVASFIGVMIGGPISDKWVKRNLRGRIYTSAIGLGMMIPCLIMIGLGHNAVTTLAVCLLFGIGYGMFDANTMPILCQFIPSRLRASAYGVLNMTGVFAGALVTQVLGEWAIEGNLGLGFAYMSVVIAIAIILQLTLLRPKTDNCEEVASDFSNKIKLDIEIN
ncbi:MAG: MFS transporter [Muribaculaceae bacterium]|nr:MFS transporter [Muribaculaceae bacterium]